MPTAIEHHRSAGRLLPLMPLAERHIESVLRSTGPDALTTARAAVSYELAMLAYGYRGKMSPHNAAMTAAELLYIAARLERDGQGEACEPEQLPPRRDPGSLDRDAGKFASPAQALTQNDVATALSHFRQAVEAQGIDLASSLADEVDPRRSEEAAEIPPAFMLPRGPRFART